MLRTTACLLLVTLSSCASAPTTADRASPEGAKASAVAPAAGEALQTRYRVGDFIVYRYQSRGAPPVTLREEIIEQQGSRLSILVSAHRGDQARSWVQVVTDTPENREAEVVDEVYEIKGGERHRLANDGNADLYRLYAWTIPPLRGEPSEVSKSNARVDIAGTSYDCLVEAGEAATEQGPARFSFTKCDDFLWTNGPAQVTAESGDVLWSRNVVEAGGPS